MEANLYHSDWYAAFVETGQEDNIKMRLEYRFKDRLHFYVPRRKLRERKDGQWHDVLRTLFPSYVLINGEIGMDEYYEFKNIPGLLKMLLSNGELISIPICEMDFISHLMAGGDIIGPSKLVEEGGHVRVTDGPLLGMEGYITKIDHRKGRVKVKMTFLGEERVMDFAANILTAF